MPRVVSREKGFTFIELVIVITVITILSSLSFVVYTHYLKKARRVEAKRILSDLTKQEEAYYVANEAYTDDVDLLGLPTLGNKKLYTITITVPDPNSADPDSFLATARGNIDGDPALDEWTINQEKELVHTQAD